MTAIPRIPIPTGEIEGAFVDFVAASGVLPGMTVLRASDRSTEVVPPYVFCWAQKVAPCGNGYYVATVRIVAVTNIDDTNDEQRGELLAKLFALFSPYDEAGKPRSFASRSGAVCVRGWEMPTPQEVSAGQEAGSAITFTAGVQLIG